MTYKKIASVLLAMIAVLIFFNSEIAAADSVRSAKLSKETAERETGQVYAGIPTISIMSVEKGKNVSLTTHNFPANERFNVTMADFGTRGVKGIVVGAIDSGNGASQTVSFDIPAQLQGRAMVAIRAQTAHASPYYAFNWFHNVTAPTPSVNSSNQVTAPAPVAVYTGNPSFTFCSVVRNEMVTFRVNNMPLKQTFAVTMDGISVGKIETGDGTTLAYEFMIPASLANRNIISMRMQTAHTFPYYAYNWFYNNSAVVSNSRVLGC